MPKVNRSGQASIWTELDLNRFLREISNPKHWLFCQLLIFTGERVGAICKLRVMDCYEPSDPPVVRKELIFRGQTRKRSKNGKAQTRICSDPSSVETDS